MAGLLGRLRRRLRAAGLPEAEALDLLALALGTDRQGALLAREVPKEAEEKALRLLEKRLQGYPLQYLLGEVEFFGLPLRVEEGVLIPRPETEGLVELALRLPLPRAARILDVGTGSGAIALALKAHLPEAEVHATEIDPKALALARENARRLGLEVIFHQAPLTGGLRDLDLLVSNPPYLPEAYREEAPKELRYENPQALYAGEEGLSVARPLAAEAWQALKPGGYLLLELAPENVHLLAGELRARGWEEVAVLRDLAGRDRYLRARRPPQEAEGEKGPLPSPGLGLHHHPHPGHPPPPPEEA
ncbi:peptide chain release factor N(5)-glutamine methyltransferase [Thermus oshimai]